MSRIKKVFIPGLSLILLLMMLLGCLPNKQGGFSCIADPLISSVKKTAGTSATRPHPPVRTGTITMGAKTQVASQSIDAAGGMVAVDKPGDPLDGFVISVPAKSYKDAHAFKVSSAPITNHSFGQDINPASPMITVENGGGYSDEVMYIRVPVKVPVGKFAMGFLYDEKSKQLEGMPLVGSDADSITVATRHFSSFFISMIEDALLKKNIDSGFRPGIDDWQFDNNGSFIAPGGHCSGQSIAAMWYYYAQPDGKDACLYNRYDNNGSQPETPNLWQDDSLGYRFCSTIQADYGDSNTWGSSLKWDDLAGISWKKENNQWKRIDGPGISDNSTWRLFAYAIQASGQPQFVSIISNAGDRHALICYAVSDNNTLRIADPNYHGRDDRNIDFVDNKFKPYNSGANAEEIAKGNGQAYQKIIYKGAWTIMPYDKIAARWIEFKNKTIGNDRFPQYDLVVVDDKGVRTPLVDGFTSGNNLLLIGPTNGLAGAIFRDGAGLTPNNKQQIELKPGNNLLGIYVLGKVGTDWEYADFKYINVIYGSLAIDPATLDGEPNKQYTFTAKTTAAPAKPRYEWSVDGAVQKSSQGSELKYTFAKEAAYSIACKLYDDASNKLIGEATASAAIKAAGNTPALVRDCKYISFVLNPKTNFVHNFYKDDMYQKNADTQAPKKYVVNEINIPVTWSGVNFSGKYKGKPNFDWSNHSGVLSPDFIADCTISGYVTADGKTIRQLNMTLIYTLAREGYTENWQYEFNDIPLADTIDQLKARDPAMRNLILEYEVYSSNNPAAHGKFSATYQGKPESYRSLDGKDKMTDGKGTGRNTMWEYYSIPELGPFRFALKVNTVQMNGL